MTFGIAKADTEMTYDELLGRADKLLYYGKTHGKNHVCIVDDLDNQINKKIYKYYMRKEHHQNGKQLFNQHKMRTGRIHAG